MNDTLHVKGLSELAKFLDELPGKLQRNVMRGALRAGAKVVQAQAKANAPKETGQLAAGIKVTTSSKGPLVFGRVVLTGRHAFLGNWLEFTGAAPHTISAKDGGALFLGNGYVERVRHPGFHPKPFMRPALDSQAGAAVVAVGNYVKDRLQTKQGLDTSDVDVELVQ